MQADIFSFLKNCAKPFKRYIALHFIVIFYCAIENSVWPLVSKILINKVAAASPENVVEQAMLPAIAIILITIATNLIWRISDYSWLKMTPELKKKINSEALEYLMQHSQNFFQNNFTGSLANKIKDLTNCAPKIIQTFLYQFCHIILVLIIALITLIFTHKLFAYAMIIWATTFILLAFYAAKKTQKLSGEIAEQSSKIVGNIVDVLGNINNVKFFTNQELESKKNNDLSDEYTTLSRQRNWLLLKFYFLKGLNFSLYFAFCTIALILLYKKQEITLGDFILIFTINGWTMHLMWQAADQLRTFLEDFGTVKQALEIIAKPIEIVDTKNAKTLEIAGDKGAEIIFENVGFSYQEKLPNAATKIIDYLPLSLISSSLQAGEIYEKLFFSNQCLTIKAGQKVGLVGHSGSGKSTFVNLILRQFNVTKGRILINNQDISQVTKNSLAGAISLIPQDPTLFHRSLFENIAYAKKTCQYQDVLEAAKMANAQEFIEKLPEKYNSLVGERGVKLSGGQRQRIAIARAFLKNSPILILDEATSQLDSITENFIQESLQKLMQDKTVIVIAHRLSTLADVDRILVFDNGKIVEDGSHLDLLSLNGHYKKLWDAQIDGFLA